MTLFKSEIEYANLLLRIFQSLLAIFKTRNITNLYLLTLSISNQTPSVPHLPVAHPHCTLRTSSIYFKDSDMPKDHGVSTTMNAQSPSLCRIPTSNLPLYSYNISMGRSYLASMSSLLILLCYFIVLPKAVTTEIEVYVYLFIV